MSTAVGRKDRVVRVEIAIRAKEASNVNLSKSSLIRRQRTAKLKRILLMFTSKRTRALLQGCKKQRESKSRSKMKKKRRHQTRYNLMFKMF